MSSSEQNLIHAADPKFMAALAENIGDEPIDLATAVAAASFEEADKVLKAAVADAVTILQAHTSWATDATTELMTLRKKIGDLEKKIADGRLCRAYYTETNNIFPLREFVGIPTSKQTISLRPGINKVPEDWEPTQV